jgi:hypothetical protein
VLVDNLKNVTPSTPATLSALRSLATYYALVNNGFAANPANSTGAYQALSSAISADRNLEGAYIGELEPKLQQIAAKAALAFALKGQLEQALSAVHLAESSGQNLGTANSARLKLDQKAAELYQKASDEKDSNPKESKALAHRITSFVDQKSPWFAKAQALF